MKRVYCKFCGRELENGKCTCQMFLNAKNNKTIASKTCDTCKKLIDSDSIFCPYCGIPVNIDGNINQLRKELRGDYSFDVLEVIRRDDLKNGRRNRLKKESVVTLLTLAIVSLMFIISFSTFVMPVINKKIDDYKLKKMLENVNINDGSLKETSKKLEDKAEVETSHFAVIEKDNWIKKDGFYYALDDKGDPVVDDWVEEVDENGVKQYYYFDIDGRLVVNSWIDGEYFVGSDGAMLRNAKTPDGATVDEDGRVLVELGEGVEVVRETYVYYESPNSSETVVASSVKSNTTGEIKGVDTNKKYELYVKKLKQFRDVLQKDKFKCTVTYYMPIIDGADEREVKAINDEFERVYVDFKDAIVNSRGDIAKSIIFNVVEQRTLNSNRLNILVQGRFLPRNGLAEKKKFRFIYDRKTRKITMADISD